MSVWSTIIWGMLIYTLYCCTYANAQLIIPGQPERSVSFEHIDMTTASDKMLRFGFLFSNTTADLYTLQHDIARGKLVRYLSDKGYLVHTEVYVFQSDEETLQVMHDWANRNFTCIFSTSGSYTSLTTRFMKENNVTRIATWGSVKPDWRAESFDNKAWQATFLAGITCGLATKSNHIAWVGFSVTRSVIRNIIAFSLGARMVNKDVAVHVSFTGNLFGPLLERRTGQYLIDNFNTDCGLGTVDGVHAFEKNNLTAIGFNGDVRYTSNYITSGHHIWFSVLNDWTNVYRRVADGIIAGTFGNAKRNVCTMSDCFDISNFSPEMPINYTHIISEYRRLIINSTTDVVYCGDRGIMAGFNLIQSNDSDCAKTSQIQALNALPSFINAGKNVTWEDVLEYFYVREDSALGIILFVTCGLSIGMGILFLFGIIINKDHNVIRQSSMLFCIIIVGGCILGLCSAFAWAGQPTLNSCLARIWVGGLALAISYGGLVVKNWRIWRIFFNPSLEVFAISDLSILGALTPILLGEIIILILWSVVDPFTVRDIPSPLLQEWQYNRRCSSNSAWPVAIFITYNALLLVLGVFVSYKTRTIGNEEKRRMSSSSGGGGGGGDNKISDTRKRKGSVGADSPSGRHVNSNHNERGSSSSGGVVTIKRRYYKESTEIGYSIFYTLLFSVICIVLITGTPYTVESEAGFIGFSIIIIFDAVLVAVFGLKFYRILFKSGGGSGGSNSNKQRSAPNTTSQSTTMSSQTSRGGGDGSTSPSSRKSPTPRTNSTKDNQKTLSDAKTRKEGGRTNKDVKKKTKKRKDGDGEDNKDSFIVDMSKSKVSIHPSDRGSDSATSSDSDSGTSSDTSSSSTVSDRDEEVTENKAGRGINGQGAKKEKINI